MNLPLHRKYRPASFDEIVGNEDTITSLKETLKEKKVTTFLFHGERGSGKTTISRIIARKVGAIDINIYEYDLGDVGLKDKARQIINSSKFSPLGGSAKVYIFDECQDSRGDFFNAMLKILEEPPPFVYFILCTTNPNKLPVAIKSRCMSFQMFPLRRPQMLKLITRICKKEGAALPKDIIKKIAEKVEGIPREALILLEKVIHFDYNIVDEYEDAELIIENHSSLGEYSPEVRDLCNALMDNRPWKEVAKILKGIKEEPENVRRSTIGYLGVVLLNKPSDRIYSIIECMSDSYMNTGKAGLISDCYYLCNS